MTPEEMHAATATFIEAHRLYQAELAERIARVEAQLLSLTMQESPGQRP